MSVEMLTRAVELADEAMTKGGDEGEVAAYIKRGMDARFPQPWHCIVGRKFSSLVTHQQGYFAYFFLGHNAVLVFKAKD